MDNTALDDIKFPLLGSSEDGETFEYILWAINPESVDIAILNWFVKRSKLYAGEKVCLYIPQVLSEQYQFRNDVSGIVKSVSPHQEMNGEVYRIAIDRLEKVHSINEFTQQLPISESLTELLVQLIKDSMLLKQGIEVYIKHIIPYFSRIVDYTAKEYNQIKKHFLQEVEKHVKINVSALKGIHQKLHAQEIKQDEIPIYIDLEALREIFESEISKNLFDAVFVKNDTDRNIGFSIYINAIKNLEKRLYSNYNQIVFIYLKSLKFSVSQD